MSATNKFEQIKTETFNKHEVTPLVKPSAAQKTLPPPQKDRIKGTASTIEMPDMSGLTRPIREKPPENGSWKMPLLSGKYFMLTFVKGEKHGPVSLWSSEDICMMDGQFEHNILNGPCRIFDSLGRITTAFTYANGQIDGYLVSYQPSGLVAYESWYVNGVQEGLMRTYNQYGEIGQDCMYHNNYRHGQCTTYFQKNQGISQISYFENGLQVGQDQIFYPNGTLMQSTPYKGGLPVDYPTPVDMQGKPIVNPFTQVKPPASTSAINYSPAPWDVPGLKPIINKEPPATPLQKAPQF